MLADSAEGSIRSGAFASDVQRPSAFRSNLIGFIRHELPKWRDHPQRPFELAETGLTSQLCAHLNSATRLSPGWDILQFRVEEPDEQERGRKIDLVPAPSGTTIWIGGRSYTHYDALLPIECKRLPVPADARRDAREYVYSSLSSTGGIQRFKAGHHGAAHDEAVMIAYVQSDDVGAWAERISSWIADLATQRTPGWTEGDALHPLAPQGSRLLQLRSVHTRSGVLPPIALTHLWIDMQSSAAQTAEARGTRHRLR